MSFVSKLNFWSKILGVEFVGILEGFFECFEVFGGEHDLYLDIEVSLLLATLDTLAPQPELFAGLRMSGDFQIHFTIQGCDWKLGSVEGFTQGEGELHKKVESLSSKMLVGTNPGLDQEITGRATMLTGSAPACYSKLGAIVCTRWNTHRDFIS